MKTVAYLRVSTRSQDLANQKLAILEFSQKRRFPIDQFIESRISSRKSPLECRIDNVEDAINFVNTEFATFKSDSPRGSRGTRGCVSDVVGNPPQWPGMLFYGVLATAC